MLQQGGEKVTLEVHLHILPISITAWQKKKIYNYVIFSCTASKRKGCKNADACMLSSDSQETVATFQGLKMCIKWTLNKSANCIRIYHKTGNYLPFLPPITTRNFAQSWQVWPESFQVRPLSLLSSMSIASIKCVVQWKLSSLQLQEVDYTFWQIAAHADDQTGTSD